MAHNVLVDPDHSDASKRCESLINTRLPSASTELLAVFHPTESPTATRATVRCCMTIAVSAHRNARRYCRVCECHRRTPSAGPDGIKTSCMVTTER